MFWYYDTIMPWSHSLPRGLTDLGPQLREWRQDPSLRGSTCLEAALTPSSPMDVSRVVPQRGGYGPRSRGSILLVSACTGLPSRCPGGREGGPWGHASWAGDGTDTLSPLPLLSTGPGPQQLHRSAPEAQVPHPRAAVQGRVTQVRVSSPGQGRPSSGSPQGNRLAPGQGQLRSGSPPGAVIPGQGHPRPGVTQVMTPPGKITFL